ncbi:hypothetical protein [Pseudomonas rossensis]|uniref:hypothetical protein n=1 Tax=Pseudomonas rossensis TaxID=2305471 RepID=UPI003261B1AA
MTPIARALLNGATGLVNLARSSPATVRTTLPGLQSSVNAKSMGWLADAAIGITADIAQFIMNAVTGGEINRDMTKGNTQYYKTIGSPPGQNGKTVGLRFDPSQGLSNTKHDSDYELTGVRFDEKTPWISRPGSSSPGSTSIASKPPLSVTSQIQRLGANFHAQSAMAPSTRSTVLSNATSLSSQAGANGVAEINATPSDLIRKPAMERPRTSLAKPLPKNILDARAKPTAHQQRIEANAFLDSLKNIKLTTEPVVPWEDLDQGMQKVYNYVRKDYENEVVQNLNGLHSEITKILNKHDMRIIQNSGVTGGNVNNCFLIAVMQHLNGDYTQVDSAKVNLYRRMLSDKDLIPENEQMSSNSAAAKLFIDTINRDGPEIDVHIISRTDKELFVERHKNEKGEFEERGRKVFVFDHGGHFEAIAQD